MNTKQLVNVIAYLLATKVAFSSTTTTATTTGNYNQSIDLYCITKNIVTQWVQAKLDTLVTSLSQLLINCYRVKMNVHQTIKTMIYTKTNR